MAKQIINVGAAANDGTGDTERAAWIKANANFAENYISARRGEGAAKLRGKVSVATMGESHGTVERMGAVITYACSAYYSADIIFDYRDYASGGNMYAVGGTTTAATGDNLLGTQIVNFEARPTDIVFIVNGYNDQPITAAAALTAATNVITAATRCFAAGALVVVVCTATPRNNVTNSTEAFQTFNQTLRNYASVTPGVRLLDLSYILADPNLSTTSTIPLKYASLYAQGAYGSLTSDGTHNSARANRIVAPYIANILREFVPERLPRLGFNHGIYDPVAKYMGNILGPAGSFIGTGAGIGLTGGFEAGVAGAASTSRVIISTSGAGPTVAPSIVIGANGEQKQRLTLGGTTNSRLLTVKITPTITAVDGGDASRRMDFEAIVDMFNVTGVTDIYLNGPTGTTTSTPYNSTSVSAACNAFLDGSSGRMFLYSKTRSVVPTGNNPGFSVFIQLSTGAVALSGDIDISGMNVMLI